MHIFFFKWMCSNLMTFVTANFTTPGWSHVYGLPYPSTESLDPIDLYYTLMFQDQPKKFPVYTYRWLLKQYSCVYTTYWPQTRVHRDVCKMTNIFGVFLIWVRITWLLAFQIPWERSNSTLHYLFGLIYKEPLGYIEGE